MALCRRFLAISGAPRQSEAITTTSKSYTLVLGIEIYGNLLLFSYIFGYDGLGFVCAFELVCIDYIGRAFVLSSCLVIAAGDFVFFVARKAMLFDILIA